MKILLVSATTFEITPLIEQLGSAEMLTTHLSRYHTKEHQIDILITGVGMVFTTFHVSTLLAQQNYDFAINAGVAGAIDKQLALGEVVQIIQDYFFEFGAENHDQWLSISDLGLISRLDLPYTEKGLKNIHVPLWLPLKELKQVKGHTVNKVHGNEQSIKSMLTKTNAQVESMEGAAFLYCCMQYQLPCAQIRAISNYVEPRNKAQWQMKEAISNLNTLLITCFSI